MTNHHLGYIKLISIIALFLLITILVLVVSYRSHSLSFPSNATTGSRPIVGAIRFDAWSKDDYTWFPKDGFRRLYSDYLSPQMWHYRLPFFAQITSSNQISMNENSQTTIDQEIQAAQKAGLSFWAFDFSDPYWQNYPPTLPDGDKPNLNYALNLYLSSQFKDQLNYSLIAFSGQQTPGTDPSFYWRQSTVVKLVRYAQDPAYQKVLSNRPLIFVFNASGFSSDQGATAKADLDYLRQQIQTTGLANPYIVGMVWDPTDPVIKKLGFDAASAYSAPQIGSATFNTGKPFTQLMSSNVSFRNRAKSTGYQVVPIVNAGWDRRPHWIDPEEPHNIWYEPATPSQIAQNLKNALDWNKAYPLFAQANTTLIYAWNEYTEGGWLGPSLLSGNDRLDAISQVLGAAPATKTVDNASLTYSGTWNSANASCAVGGTWRHNSLTGSYVTHSFTGTKLWFLSVNSTNRGKAKIYIDNTLVDTVDEFSPTGQTCSQSGPYSTASFGPHTLRVVVSGTKNPSSTGFDVSVDAIKYQ